MTNDRQRTTNQDLAVQNSTFNAQQLTIALPKGRMQHQALALLAQIGYGRDADDPSDSDAARRLIIPGAAGRVRFLLAKPGDVPIYVEYGVADLGVVGEDVLRESGRDVYEPLRLPFGHCRLVVAGWGDRPPRPLRLEPNPRVATKYPNLAHAYFQGRGISAEIIALSGSIELAPVVGLADLIVDLVETGSTLRAHGLVELRTILESQACLIANRASYRLKAEGITELLERLRRALMN
jgi:ATP phosphoribosyltransferase